MGTRYFNKLPLQYRWIVVLKEVWIHKDRRLFKIRCFCWATWYKNISQLKNNSRVSCWCDIVLHKKKTKRETLILKRNRVTLTDRPLYSLYWWIIQRCYNNNSWNYSNYWRRWIKCEWRSYFEFEKDMYDLYIEHCNKYWKENTSLDRIDVNWNYSKRNCRWATRVQQSRNKTNNIFVEYEWKEVLLLDLLEKKWLENRSSFFYQRLNKWECIEDILFDINILWK